MPISAATVALFAISPVVAAGSLQPSALATMLPFAAILAVAAAGQTLVIQQGGLDFSVAGMISLSAVLLTKLADEHADRLPSAIAVVLLVAALVGLASGLAITKLGVTPLIATLGVNALLLGLVQEVSGGKSVPPAPDSLNELALDKTFGVFNLVLVAAALVALLALLIKRTVAGRHFEAIGASAPAAHVAGLAVNPYKISAYVAASLSYALAGVMLAGFLRTPPLDVGTPYLLSTIAAVVVGGTALSGGAGSVVATAIGALFLTQLGQLMLASGAETSVNFLVQGTVIGASMALRTAVLHWRDARGREKAIASAARRASDRDPDVGRLLPTPRPLPASERDL